MFPTLIRRLADRARSRVSTQPVQYKLKKVWPPDFSRLSSSEQLGFEKRYKRRLRLMGARPRWNRIMKLAQLFSVTFVVIYGLLFMTDAKTGEEPFHEFRQGFWNFFRSLSMSETRRSENFPKQVDGAADRSEKAR